MTKGWGKISIIAEHLGLSVRVTRELIKAEAIPITRLPSGTVIGNLSEIDRVLLERGDEVAKAQQRKVDKLLGGIR